MVKSPLSELSQQIAPSATLTMNRRAKELQACGKTIYNLASGEPYWDTPEPIKEAARRALADGVTKYGPTQGFLSLREKVSQDAQRQWGTRTSPSEVLISSGAKQSLYLALQALLNPGDKVLLPKPCWVSYVEMVKMCRAEPILVNASFEEKFIFDPENIPKEGEKAKLLLLNNPCNPTGALLSRKALAKIAAFAEKSGCFIVCDEIYAAFVLGETPFTSMAQVAPSLQSQLLLVGGVSKTYSMTGWRIGIAVGPEPLIAAMTRLQDHQSSCANTIAQKAAEAALTLGDELLQDHLEEVRQTAQEATALIARSGLPISLLPPQGAFYLFPDFSPLLGKKLDGQRIATTTQLASALLEKKGVATVPGEAFLEARGGRFSLARKREEVCAGIARVCEFAQDLD